jgi:transposase
MQQPDLIRAIVRNVLARDPMSGRLFVSFNKRKDRVKVLFWDRRPGEISHPPTQY